MGSEEFTNEFIGFIRDGKGDSVRKHYREVITMIVDDAQVGDVSSGPSS